MYWHRLWPIYRREVARFIAPSRFMAEKMAAFGWPSERIETILHPVRLPARPLTSPSGSPYALYFGRLAPEKGLETLLQALRKTDVRLWIAGEGPMLPGLLRQAEGLGARVRFTGFLEGEALHGAIAGARFVVVPSEWYEVFGLTIGETFAHQRAVVASRIGAIPELVRHHQTGLLFSPGDAEEMASRMQYLWQHPKEAEAMGRAGYETVRSLCDPERHYERIYALYREVCDLPGAI